MNEQIILQRFTQKANWFRLFTYYGSLFNINKHCLNSKVIAYKHVYFIVCTAVVLFKNAFSINQSFYFFFPFYFPDLYDLGFLPLLATNQFIRYSQESSKNSAIVGW